MTRNHPSGSSPMDSGAMVQQFESYPSWVQVTTSPSLLPSSRTTLLSKVTALPEIRSDNSEALGQHHGRKAFSLPTLKSITCSAILGHAHLHGSAAVT